MDNLVGQTLNRYKINALIGEGGMGAVFLATDMALERDVAVKIMHPNYARQPNFQQRFLQEARTAARMNHPGIVQVYDFGQDRGRLYIVMKFIAGDNLEEMLEGLRESQRWIPLKEAVGLTRLIALALDYAHRQGVLHRDLKPSNIMLEPEPADGLSYRPVITDLGLAKLVKSGVATQDHTSMGTPAYMSPEQTLGQKTDARSDVYSLGVLLFELATGRLPFNARSLGEAIKFHVQTPPPKPRTFRPELPESLERIILQALEKEPSRRFQNAGALAEALRSISAEVENVTAAPDGIQEMVSLFTQYQNSLAQPRGISIFENQENLPETQASVSSADRIQLVTPDGATRALQVHRPSMTIGRDPDNDIPLDDPKSSRRHARIEFDGQSYRVVDLNSTNGTYLGGSRLIPGMPQVWGSETALRIGDSYLRLMRPGFPLPGTQAATTVGGLPATKPLQRDPVFPPAPTSTSSPPVSTAFTSELRPNRVKAGQVGRLIIRNLGSGTDTYSLNWDLGTDEIEFTPPSINVNAAPGQEVVVEFRADSRRSNIFGAARRHGFSAVVRPSAGPPQIHPGEVTVESMLPGWALPVLLALCLALAGISALLASSLFGPIFPAGGPNLSATALMQTQLANAIQTQTLMGQSAAFTQTAESYTATHLADANQATVIAATATGSANSTAFAATQTGIVLAAQTAVAETAQAQQATLQAALTQTALSLQGTAAAQATQTAAAIALTQTAGHLQTSVVQTAAAQTAEALSATLTVQAAKRIAYIHAGDLNKANDYKSFLQSQQHWVDIIPIDNILTTNFGLYHLILIGPETGDSSDYQNNPWGDANEVQANALAAYNLPIIGLGKGGSLFFQAIGLTINWGQSWVGAGDSVVAVNPGSPYWLNPTNIGVPFDGMVRLYDSSSGFVAVHLPGPIAGITTVGRQTNDTEHYPLIQEGNRFFLWGFDDGPADMANKGRRTLLNIIWNLLQ